MEVIRIVGTEPTFLHLLVTNLHFRPFAPYFCEVFNGFEVDLGSLLEYLSRTFQVPLRFALYPTFLVEFSKVDVEPVEVRRGFSGTDRG